MALLYLFHWHRAKTHGSSSQMAWQLNHQLMDVVPPNQKHSHMIESSIQIQLSLMHTLKVVDQVFAHFSKALMARSLLMDSPAQAKRSRCWVQTPLSRPSKTVGLSKSLKTCKRCMGWYRELLARFSRQLIKSMSHRRERGLKWRYSTWKSTMNKSWTYFRLLLRLTRTSSWESCLMDKCQS